MLSTQKRSVWLINPNEIHKLCAFNYRLFGLCAKGLEGCSILKCKKCGKTSPDESQRAGKKNITKGLRKELLRLPAYTLAAGIVLRIISAITIRITTVNSSEWTPEVSAVLFCVNLVCSIALFIGIGLLLRKSYSRADFFKSATLLLAYYLVVFGVEQLTQYLGVYNMAVNYFFLPVEVFSVLIDLALKMSNAETLTWVHLIPSMLAPYLFVLFSKKKESEVVI